MKYMVSTFLVLCALISHSQTQTIISIAGNGSSTFSGDGGPATVAGLSETGICKDATGNLYISDATNVRVRKISAAGIISTVVGNGIPGFGGDGSPATAGNLTTPSGLAMDGAGNLYIADGGSGRIRKVNTSGIISTIAGGGSGYTDGIPATSFALLGVNGVCVDGVGNIYLSWGNMVKKVTTAGLIYTFAGSSAGVPGYSGDGGPGTAARLFQPYGLSIDVGGNIYIADQGNNCIRKVNSSGIISTFAGKDTAGYSGDGGAATAAKMYMPYAIAFDGSANAYIADGNAVIRKVSSAGIITTIAGGGISFADGGPATATNMGPVDVCTDVSGNIYLCDAMNYRVRKICGSSLSSGTIHGDSVLCSGSTTILSDSIVGGVWTSSDTSVATITSGGVVTGFLPTTVTMKYTISNACGSVYSTKHITVNPLPVTGYLSFVPTAPYPSIAICVGNKTEIWPTLTGGALSSSDTSVGTIDTFFSHPYLTAHNAGTTNVSYKVTNGYGCTSVATYTVTSLANPVVSPIMGASVLCIGDTITLADVTAGGVWSSSNSTVANIGSTGMVYGMSLGTTTISYTVTDTFTCRTVDSVSENVNCNVGIQAIQNSAVHLNLIPNPISEKGRIEFTLPQNISQGEINIYDVSGKKLKSYSVDHTFGYITVDNLDFPPGIYFYNLTANGLVSQTKKMLVIK